MRLTIAALLIPCLLSATSAWSQDELDRSRQLVREDVANSNIGAGYAQMLNFFIDPSISASLLESDDGTEYDVFKIPLQYEMPIGDNGWQLAIRGTLSHASATNTFSLVDAAISEGESIDGEWEADSGSLGAGLIIPASDSLSFVLAGEFGISRLENTADYNGPISRQFVAPVVDGVLFNWDTNARIVSLSGGVDYRTQLAEKYNTSITGRYTHSQIASYSESRDLDSFREDTGTASIKADIRHPWGMSLGASPLFGVAHAGGTAFTGKNRDALGFTHFYELGYSIGLDISEQNRYLKSLSIGYQYNIGSDVDGYSILFGWELK